MLSHYLEVTRAALFKLESTGAFDHAVRNGSRPSGSASATSRSWH